MYAYIKGKLTFASPLYAVLESHGVGYKISIPASVFAKLPELHSEVLLHTSFVTRENFQGLYGFLALHELELFETFQNVNGIGPKLALSLVGNIALEDLHRALNNHDIATLSKVPGVGKKIAERLVIELRDKLDQLFPNSPSEYAIKLKSDPKAQKISDAMSAMIHLGYNQNTAQKAIKKTMQDLPEDCDLGLLITTALKNI